VNAELDWLDQPAKTAPPFESGDLFEKPDGPHLRYYRVVAVDEDGSRIIVGYAVGVIEGANAPNIAKALSA